MNIGAYKRDEYLKLQKEIGRLEAMLRLKVFQKQKEFALKHTRYKVGDIVMDHIGRAKIIKVKSVYLSDNKCPSLVFLCNQLTKSGSVNKRRPERLVYEINILNP